MLISGCGGTSTSSSWKCAELVAPEYWYIEYSVRDFSYGGTYKKKVEKISFIQKGDNYLYIDKYGKENVVVCTDQGLEYKGNRGSALFVPIEDGPVRYVLLDGTKYFSK